MYEPSAFSPVFDALNVLIQSGCTITILIGNHDLELSLPAVQEALARRLHASPHQLQFHTDGRAYRIGGVLIEHGNRYDDANNNDWDRLRMIVSAQSRFETAPEDLRVSFGSPFVADHVNPLKIHYPFLDLIQPQNELVALLLLAFEPQLAWDWGRICNGIRAQRLSARNKRGVQPGSAHQIFGQSSALASNSLREAFGAQYEMLLAPNQDVGVAPLMRVYMDNRKDSLADLLQRDISIPGKRIKKLKTALHCLLKDDTSARLDGPTEQYGEAAKRLIRDGGDVEVVIMGHTHQPRSAKFEKGQYLNTGTWADRIFVPTKALVEPGDNELVVFLRDLLRGIRPMSAANYADIRVDGDGHAYNVE
jgi:UDP-2,3-diacylglucosamine pyrophosphatase LpxH